jgi:crotonobetainyl-CoA:carnitine CoA-transferase CaiB-like acyl-CoA transferase
MSGAGSDEPGRAWAHAYGAHLLSSLGVGADLADFRADCAAISWARAGLANVTGMQAGPPLAAPVALSAAADGALGALGALAQSVSLKAMRGSALLGARVRLNRLQRQGATSPGGSCKLLHTADGMVAVNLPRQSDWDLAPAWLEQSASSWPELAARLLSMRSETALARARLLGLAVGPADVAPPTTPWFKAARLGVARPRPSPSTPLVIDLSSLWAGPLCGDLLGRLGARVVKVESVRRPDGARTGDADFYAMLNGAKASIGLDFADRNDLALLERLIRMADIVIESARPRALRQLGLDAETLVRDTPGLTWIALSAYGRDEPEANWVGFGDDCGAAGGLSRLMQEVSGQAIFCGDAIADPLAGIHAALVAWSSWKRGGGVLNAIALRDVVASVVARDAGLSASERRARWLTWTQLATTMTAKPYGLPPPQGAAEALGASNHLLHTL